MPYIRITSLPFNPPLAIDQVLVRVSEDFSQQMGIALKHISVSWHFFEKNHYVVAGNASEFQSKQSHPIMVTILAPDFTQQPTIEKMLFSVAKSLARLTGVDEKNIFITYQAARSGQVFDNGQLVHW